MPGEKVEKTGFKLFSRVTLGDQNSLYKVTAALYEIKNFL